MKSIDVPDDITLMDPLTEKPVKGPDGVVATWTFRQWAITYLLNDERSRGADVEATARLYTHVLPAFAIATCVPGASVLLEDADHARFVSTAKSPRAGVMNVILDAQLAPFSSAYLGAKDVAAPSPAPKSKPRTVS